MAIVEKQIARKPCVSEEPCIRAAAFLTASSLLPLAALGWLKLRNPQARIADALYSRSCPASIALRTTFLASGGALCYWLMRMIAQGGHMPTQLVQHTNMKGKTVLITGGNSGIGKETALQLVNWGARVILACRNRGRAQAALEDIKKRSSGGNAAGLEIMDLDLSDLESVKKLAETIDSRHIQIDILINNAGVMMTPFSKTKQGFEMQFGTNHLGHFLLTKLLMKNLNRNSARIINVSSMAHRMSLCTRQARPFSLEEVESVTGQTYSRLRFYKISKLSNILFTKELQQRLNEEAFPRAVTYALHPGAICTDLQRHIPFAAPVFAFLNFTIAKTPRSGAQTTLYLCSAPSEWLSPGGYYQDCTERQPFHTAEDPALAKDLWEFSERAVTH